MNKHQIKIDIVSDIVCPWCIIGFLRLQKALDLLDNSIEVTIEWHPFELAPDLKEGGDNLRAFLQNKFGSDENSAQQMRQRITEEGASLGFEFNFTADSMRYNTFKAHQLLTWSAGHNKQTALKLALFKAYFSDNKNIGDTNTLADIAETVHLDRAEAIDILNSGQFKEETRSAQQHWLERGINSVPSQIVQQQYLIQGAQPPRATADMLEQILKNASYEIN